MRYLDPKADLTFKKIFGEHPDLIVSLINALLPDNTPTVKEVEYLPTELVPDTPLRKNSIVDVRCRDVDGRQFLVEMQMIWSPEFKQRMLFNASKAYVRQLDSSENYRMLQPVYSINLVNEIFEPEITEFYHNYALVHELYTDKVIEGLHLIFVELPKFHPRNYGERRMRVLWLRFLTEINEKTRYAPEELLADPEVSRALQVVEESAFDEVQMAQYDKFWDIVRVERTHIAHAEERGVARGIAQGIAQGITQGRTEREMEIVRKMKAAGMSTDTIAQITGLSVQTIERL